jgi:hypothetical protein
MKTFRCLIGFSLFILMFLISCASSQITPEQPLSASLNAYKNFVISVEPEVTEDVEKEMSDLSGLVLSKVMALNVFDKVVLKDEEELEENSLLLRIIITDIRKVGSASRFWLGAFAGEAHMTNKLLFIDYAANDTLGEYSVTGRSGGSAFSGGTNEAINKTLEAIVEVISDNYNM